MRRIRRWTTLWRRPPRTGTFPHPKRSSTLGKAQLRTCETTTRPREEAEERGQGEAIARNIYEMIRLKVPVICIIIGEGASGGALGIGVGDKVLMLENSWYTVISPENCSSILWRSWAQKEVAAEQLKLTSEDMLKFGLVDGIIPEPLGGAHWNYDEAAANLKSYIKPILQKLKKIDPQKRVDQRIEKFNKMGFWDEK